VDAENIRQAVELGLLLLSREQFLEQLAPDWEPS